MKFRNNIGYPPAAGGGEAPSVSPKANLRFDGKGRGLPAPQAARTILGIASAICMISPSTALAQDGRWMLYSPEQVSSADMAVREWNLVAAAAATLNDGTVQTTYWEPPAGINGYLVRCLDLLSADLVLLESKCFGAAEQ